MFKIYEILGIPFGFVIAAFYALSENYLFSVLCLTLIVKLALLPSSISQQKAQAKQARLQPKVRKIQEKYAGNQRKIQEETTALYQREGYSAMGAGCMPMIMQLVVMTGLYQVNYHPFSMVLRISRPVVDALKEAVVPLLTGAEAKATFRLELFALQSFEKIRDSVPELTQEMVLKIQTFRDNFTFLGLDLAHTPEFKSFDFYWAIPIVSGLVGLGMGVYSMLYQKKINPEMAKNPMSGCMMLMTPAMNIYFAFLFPTVVGIYIILSSLVSFLQIVILNYVYSPKKVLARLMIEETVERRSKEENIKKVSEMNRRSI